MVRKIIHIDMDAFFASAEQLDAPELRGRPVVVGGSPESRAVVCAASYEARRFGVHSAMPCSQAYRLCPQAVFRPPRFDRYKELSQIIRGLFFKVSPLVEPLSLDEAFLDVTTNGLQEKSATRVAQALKTSIYESTGLTASAGVAANKFLAKLASDWDKPNGLTVIPPKKAQAFIDDLEVACLWGAGPATVKKLNSMGLYRIKDLRTRSADELFRLLGKHGLFLHQLAHGKDERPVKAHRIVKSRGVEQTFHKDITELSHLKEVLSQQVQELSEHLKKKQRVGFTITLKMRYADFRTITRSQTLSIATNECSVLGPVAQRLLTQQFQSSPGAFRLLGLSLSNLSSSRQSDQEAFPDFPHQLFFKPNGI